MDSRQLVYIYIYIYIYLYLYIKYKIEDPWNFWSLTIIDI